jgi:hypothetical protein
VRLEVEFVGGIRFENFERGLELAIPALEEHFFFGHV